MPNKIAQPPETMDSCGSAQSPQPTINIPPTGPQEFDLLTIEREAMEAAGIPPAMLPPLPTFTLEEGHRNVGGFGV